MLVIEPENRLKSIKIIKAHPFFQEVTWENVEDRSMESPLKLKFRHSCDLRYFTKSRYPPMVFTDQESMDLSVSELSNFSDLSYNSEIKHS